MHVGFEVQDLVLTAKHCFADIASKQAVVPYDTLMQALELNDIRQLEDKIILCL